MSKSIKLLTWNIGFLDDGEHPDAIPAQAAAINFADPDLVFINEARRFGKEDRDNQILELSGLTRLKYVEFAVATDVGVFGARGQKLIGIISRFPLSNANPLGSFCDGVFSESGCFRTLEVVTTIDDRLYYLYATRWSWADEGNNIKIAGQLRDRILALQSNYREACFIVGGDLNQGALSMLHAPPVTFTAQYSDLIRSTGMTDSYLRDLSTLPVDVVAGMPDDYLLYRAPALARDSHSGPTEGPGQDSGTDHKYEATTLEPFNSQFIQLAVQSVATIGIPITFEFTFKNTSEFTWTSAHRISLVLKDSFGWNRITAVLATNVEPRAEVTFSFETTPTQIGARSVQAQLRCQDVWRFGDSTPTVQVLVGAATTEPIKCDDLRGQISEIDNQIRELTDALAGDPRTDVKLKNQIAQLMRNRVRIVNDGNGIGCIF